MKQSGFLLLAMLVLSTTAFAQKNQNTLLWQITGNGLEKPSYLYGTMHLVCENDAVLSPKLNEILVDVEKVYFEIDLDNMMELLGLLDKMEMKDGQTWKDLLTPSQYQDIKKYCEGLSLPLPFSKVEKFMPMLASVLFIQEKSDCGKMVSIEEKIKAIAQQNKKEILGLEKAAYQLAIFEKIPYKEQAKILYDGIVGGEQDTEFDTMLSVYRNQDLDALNKLILSKKSGLNQYNDAMIFTRNENWVNTLGETLNKHSAIYAVGAGHLVGEKGVIKLLRSKGYTLTPLENTVK